MLVGGNVYVVMVDMKVGQWNVFGYLLNVLEQMCCVDIYKQFIDKLMVVVKFSQCKIVQINVLVFGFFCGAVEVCVFMYWLYEFFMFFGGVFEIVGVLICIGFFGIFDMVVLVGIGDVMLIIFGYMVWVYNM